MPEKAAPTQNETPSTQSRQELEAELRQSSESAKHLLDDLARKLRTAPAVRSAAGGLQRAARYVRSRGVRDMGAGIQRLVRRRPAYSIAAAVVAGYLAGRALSRR